MRIVLLTLVTCLGTLVPANAYPGGPILLYGDSRARGVTGPGTSISDYWNAAHPEHPIVNDSGAGRTTVLGLKNARASFHHFRPSVIVLWLDVNDQLIGLTPEQTARNLYRLARLARTHQTEVYVLSNVARGPFTLHVAALEHAWPTMRRINLASLWLTDEEFRPFTIDGTHLNATGNARVAEYLDTLLLP